MLASAQKRLRVMPRRLPSAACPAALFRRPALQQFQVCEFNLAPVSPSGDGEAKAQLTLQHLGLTQRHLPLGTGRSFAPPLSPGPGILADLLSLATISRLLFVGHFSHDRLPHCAASKSFQARSRRTKCVLRGVKNVCSKRTVLSLRSETLFQYPDSGSSPPSACRLYCLFYRNINHAPVC